MNKVSVLCRCLGWSRQAYYKRRELEGQRQSQDELVLDEVRQIRFHQTRVGTRKLQAMIQPRVEIGRDRLFSLLRRNHLLIRQRRQWRRTTYAGHTRFPNRIKNQPKQALTKAMVADITYIQTRQGFLYLFLVTHYASRKIVGYCLSRDLGANGSASAFAMALKQMPDASGGIHHSDRGRQYSSHQMIALANKHGVEMSMTEDDHVYENAVAERVNGILKSEFLLGEVLASHAIAHKQVAQAIAIYNNERLHTSLGLATPSQTYQKMCQLF